MSTRNPDTGARGDWAQTGFKRYTHTSGVTVTTDRLQLGMWRVIGGHAHNTLHPTRDAAEAAAVAA